MNKLLSALTVVALLVAACGDDDDDASSTSTTESTTSTTDTPPQPTTSAPDTPRLLDPADTARAWIAAIAGGDDDGAIALTSPRSLEAVGGPEGFAELDVELAEGWGAWDVAENLEVSAVALTAPAGTAIVLLHGDVPQEGPPAESWAALAVVATDEGDRVEPFLQLGDVEAHPEPNGEIPSDTRFAAYVLGGRDVQFIVDDGQPVVPALQGADGDRQLAELDVSDLEPGLHSLTVVLSNADGVMARTFLYRVS